MVECFFMLKEKIDKQPTHYILPSDNKELTLLCRQFKLDMMEQIISSIEYAIENNLPLVEVFQFKNSEFVITLSEKDYLTNVENIYNYYMETESYEYCPRVVRLQKTIKEKSNKTDEKQKRRICH